MTSKSSSSADAGASPGSALSPQHEPSVDTVVTVVAPQILNDEYADAAGAGDSIRMGGVGRDVSVAKESGSKNAVEAYRFNARYRVKSND